MSVRSLLLSLLVGLWVSFVAVCAHSPELREAEGADKPGGVQYTEDEYAEAEPLAQRSLAIREKTLGPQHPAVATGLIGLAAGQRIHPPPQHHEQTHAAPL